MTVERNIEFTEGTVVTFFFSAFKYVDDEDLQDDEEYDDSAEAGGPDIHYNITLTLSRPVDDGFYLPSVSPNLASSLGLISKEGTEYDITEPRNNDEDEDDAFDVMARPDSAPDYSNWEVGEVLDFFIDDESLSPHKEVRYMYYDDQEELAAVVEGNSYLGSAQFLSEIPDEDIALHLLDASLSTSFSEADIRVITWVIKKLGFTMLEGMQ